MRRNGTFALVVAAGAVLAAGIAGALSGAKRRPGAVFKPKHPTHKIVCSCKCLGETSGVPLPWNEDETHDVPASGNCADLNGIECADGAGKLGRCKKISVPVEAVMIPIDEFPDRVLPT